MILFPRFRKRGPDVTVVPKNPVLQFGTIGLFVQVYQGDLHKFMSMWKCRLAWYPWYGLLGPVSCMMTWSLLTRMEISTLSSEFRVPGYHCTEDSLVLDLFYHNFWMIKILYRENQYEERWVKTETASCRNHLTCHPNVGEPIAIIMAIVYTWVRSWTGRMQNRAKNSTRVRRNFNKAFI